MAVGQDAGRDPGAGDGPVVIGVDIGTTSTKAVAFTVDGRALASSGAGYPLLEPAPGHAVQEPDDIVAAVLDAIRGTVAQLGGRAVAGLSFSAAMHSLLGLSPEGRPLTPVVTWADTRAARQAERLRASATGLALHRRTGTPLHPMSPLPKLVWFREQEPKLWEQVGHWGGIKEYVMLRLCGVLAVDHSVASATGLMDSTTMQWDPEALNIAALLPEQLAELVPTTAVLPGLLPEVALLTQLPADTPVVIGGSDGPLANLGSGAVQPGVASCTIGTSGALRIVVDRPVVDPLGRVFCYALTDGLWVVGGAINNGGVVLEWAGDALAPDLGPGAQGDLLELAAQVPAGSGGLLMLPYLLSERAPHWSSIPQGAYVGLSRVHRREHLVRAAVEGVCLQLALVLQSMRAAGLEVRQIRASGGFARSPMWRQLLADALGMEIGFAEGQEGSSFGAALVGMQALGLVESVGIAQDLVPVRETVRPDPADAATYALLLPVFSELYHALVPTFTSLRRLAPGLPASAAPQTDVGRGLPPPQGR